MEGGAKHVAFAADVQDFEEIGHPEPPPPQTSSSPISPPDSLPEEPVSVEETPGEEAQKPAHLSQIREPSSSEEMPYYMVPRDAKSKVEDGASPEPPLQPTILQAPSPRASLRVDRYEEVAVCFDVTASLEAISRSS